MTSSSCTLIKEGYVPTTFDKETYNTTYFRKRPWLKSFYNARRRCVNGSSYHKRGVKFLMTKEDFEWLWGRDQAWLMSKPSINRKNPDKNYTRNNCEFIEHYDNVTNCRRFGKKHTEQGKKNISIAMRRLYEPV